MSLNLTASSPSQALKIIEACYHLEETVMLHGNPGIGKSELIAYFAREVIRGECLIAMLPQLDAPDIRGLPSLNDEEKMTEWYRPEFLPTKPGPGVVFLDEINGAEPRIQKAAYQLLLNRSVGRYQLPKGWLIAAAGNMGSDGAVIYQMDTPAANRMVHIQLMADPEEWIQWAMKHAIASEVISFIRSRPDMLDGNKQQVDGELLLGPTPRGWARLSRFITDTQLDRRSVELVACGILGQATAASFMAVFDEVRRYATVDALLKNKGEKRMKMYPKSLAGMYNLAYGLTAYVNKTNWEEIIGVALDIEKLDGQYKQIGLAEVVTLTMELLLTKLNEIGVGHLVPKNARYQQYAERRTAIGLASR